MYRASEKSVFHSPLHLSFDLFVMKNSAICAQNALKIMWGLIYMALYFVGFLPEFKIIVSFQCMYPDY